MKRKLKKKFDVNSNLCENEARKGEKGEKEIEPSTGNSIWNDILFIEEEYKISFGIFFYSEKIAIEKNKVLKILETRFYLTTFMNLFDKVFF